MMETQTEKITVTSQNDKFPFKGTGGNDGFDHKNKFYGVFEREE